MQYILDYKLIADTIFNGNDLLLSHEKYKDY